MKSCLFGYLMGQTMSIQLNVGQRASRALRLGMSAMFAAVLSASVNYAGIRSDAEPTEPLQYATQKSIPAVGPIAGPALGNWLTDSYSWSWILHIGAPVVLLAAAVTWMIYRDRESATHRLTVDKVSPISRVVWGASLQIMCDRGKDLDWFNWFW